MSVIAPTLAALSGYEGRLVRQMHPGTAARLGILGAAGLCTTALSAFGGAELAWQALQHQGMRWGTGFFVGLFTLNLVRLVVTGAGCPLHILAGNWRPGLTSVLLFGLWSAAWSHGVIASLLTDELQSGAQAEERLTAAAQASARQAAERAEIQRLTEEIAATTGTDFRAERERVRLTNRRARAEATLAATLRETTQPVQTPKDRSFFIARLRALWAAPLSAGLAVLAFAILGASPMWLRRMKWFGLLEALRIHETLRVTQAQRQVESAYRQRRTYVTACLDELVPNRREEPELDLFEDPPYNTRMRGPPYVAGVVRRGPSAVEELMAGLGVG